MSQSNLSDAKADAEFIFRLDWANWEYDVRTLKPEYHVRDGESRTAVRAYTKIIPGGHIFKGVYSDNSVYWVQGRDRGELSEVYDIDAKPWITDWDHIMYKDMDGKWIWVVSEQHIPLMSIEEYLTIHPEGYPRPDSIKE